MPLSKHFTLHHRNAETAAQFVALELVEPPAMFSIIVQKLLFDVHDTPEAHADVEASVAHGVAVGHRDFEARKLVDVA